MPDPYQINPAPQSGTSAFGLVPGPIGLPDPFSDVNKAFGGDLGAANKLASTDILAELGGNVSPGTMNALTLAAAQRGVGSGMGGLSGLSTNDLFGNIAGFSEAQQQKGFQNYNQTIPTIAQTQTVNPALQAEIASRNATFGAAPNPAAAASYARQLFEEYLNKLRGGVGGTPRGGYSIVGSPGGGYGTPVTPRTPGYGGGGGGGVGLPPGGVNLPGDEDFFDWFSGTGMYDPGSGTQVGGGAYTPGESPTAPVRYPGGIPPAAGGIDWTDPLGLLGGTQPGGPDSITAPPTEQPPPEQFQDVLGDLWDF